MMSATRATTEDIRIPIGSAPAVADGVLVAPLNAGPWAAIENLRRRMRALRGGPRVVFLVAIDDRGRIVSPDAPVASQLALGYRLQVRAAKRT